MMPKVLKGMKKGLTLGISYFPFAFTFGLVASHFGLNLFKTGLMSAIIYAGSSQIIIIDLASKHLNMFQIIIAAVIVNIRYLLINMPIINKQRNYPTFIKVLSSLFLTDESVAYLTITKSFNVYETFGFGFCSYLCFLFATIIGALSQNLIPKQLTNSLQFVLYAVFLCLLTQVLMSNFKYIKVIVLSLLIKFFLNFIGMPSYLSLILTITLASFISSILYKEEDNKC